MRTKYQVCSKYWTDINITYAKRNIRHCCKTDRDDHVPIEEVRELGPLIFDFGTITREGKTDMTVNDRLPRICRDCMLHDPNSIRHVWNQWTDDYIEEIRPTIAQEMLTTYIEFDIGNQCDLACVYCGPWSSTTWGKELHHGKAPGNDTEWAGAVVDALVEYLKMLPKDRIITFNILGGEPTLMGETFDIIERMKHLSGHFDHRPRFMVTTNLNTKPALFKRFTKMVRETSDFFEWCVGVSIEDIGERAELTRYGLVWDRFESNLVELKEIATIYLTTTISGLSMPRFGEFLEWSFALLGQDRYNTSWFYSLNSVQNNFSDIAYISPDLIDVGAIRATYSRLSGQLNDDMQQFLTLLEKRIGTKTVTDEYMEFWAKMSKRRNVDYMARFPQIGETILRALDIAE